MPKKGNYYIHGNKINETLVGDLEKSEKCIEPLLVVDLSLDNVGQKKPDPEDASTFVAQPS